MGHPAYVRPDGQWLTVMVPTANDARRFDVAQSQLVNGDAGGSWTPAAPVVLGGAGLQMLGGGHQVAGGASTELDGRVVLGHSDYPTFQTNYTRSIVVPLLGGYSGILVGARAPVISLSPFGSVLQGSDMSFPFSGRDLHRGGIISTAILTFRISKPHNAVPAVTPAAFLTRSDWWAPYYLDLPWQADITHSVGDLVIPTTPNGYVYAATTFGPTDPTTEPTWPTTAGATVVDNAVTWVCTGYSQAPQWAGFTAFAAGKIAQPTTLASTLGQPPSANGFVYRSSGGTTVAGQPAWPTTVTATVADGSTTWTCLGTPGPFDWIAHTAYAEGQLVTPKYTGNGLIYQNQANGTSGSGPVAWPTVVGQQVNDGTAKWLCMGSMTIGQAAVVSQGTAASYFAAGAAQTLSLPCAGGGPSIVATDLFSYTLNISDESGIGAYGNGSPWQASANYSIGDSVIPYRGRVTFYFIASAITTGISGTAQPNWNAHLTIGSTVVDNGVTWKCAGLVGTSQNVVHSLKLNFVGIADMRPE